MNLDVRLPVGLMFILQGVLLAVYGAVRLHDEAMRPTGIPITLYWGLAMLAFGAWMLGSGLRDRRRG